MRSFPELKPNFRDALVALAVAALAAAVAAATWFGSTQEDLQAVISVDGQELQRISLEEIQREEHLISGSSEYILRVILTTEGVWVEESDCPTQDCVHTGKITRSGQSIVCLPGRVIVSLEGGENSGPDVVIG